MKLPTNNSLANHMFIHLKVCKQMTDVKSLLFYNNTWNHLTVRKKCLKMLSTKCVYKSYIFNMQKEDLARIK